MERDFRWENGPYGRELLLHGSGYDTRKISLCWDGDLFPLSGHERQDEDEADFG